MLLSPPGRAHTLETAPAPAWQGQTCLIEMNQLLSQSSTGQLFFLAVSATIPAVEDGLPLYNLKNMEKSSFRLTE